MKTYSEYIWLKRQLAEMQEILSQNMDSPLMRVSLEKRIAILQSELDSIGTIKHFDTSIKLWFGGEAVYGSMGIFADFASKTSTILSNMIATKYIEITFEYNNKLTPGAKEFLVYQYLLPFGNPALILRELA